MDMVEEQSREEINTELEVEEDIRLSDDMQKHWKDFVEQNIHEKGKVYELRYRRKG